MGLAGSVSGLCSRRAFPRNAGQTSSAHRVMTVSSVAGSISCPDFERWVERSIPSSAITFTAQGLTRDGWLPALCTRARPPSSCRASPSAIWLRAELATQRKSRPGGLTLPLAWGRR